MITCYRWRLLCWRLGLISPYDGWHSLPDNSDALQGNNLYWGSGGVKIMFQLKLWLSSVSIKSQSEKVIIDIIWNQVDLLLSDSRPAWLPVCDPPFLALILTLSRLGSPPVNTLRRTRAITLVLCDHSPPAQTQDMANQHIPHTDLRSLVQS